MFNRNSYTNQTSALIFFGASIVLTTYYAILTNLNEVHFYGRIFRSGVVSLPLLVAWVFFIRSLLLPRSLIERAVLLIGYFGCLIVLVVAIFVSIVFPIGRHTLGPLACVFFLSVVSMCFHWKWVDEEQNTPARAFGEHAVSE